MPVLARWRAKLAARLLLLTAARRRHEWTHSPQTRALLDKRKAQVAEAERVVARHSAASDISDAGVRFVASFEGESLSAYRLPGETYWTIGDGHYGPDVKPGEKITHARALELLHQDCAEAAGAVRALGIDFKQREFDALVSIVLNNGPGILDRGRTMGDALRSGDRSRIAAAFLVYDHDSTGAVSPGLVSRRQAERRMYLG